MKKMETSDDKVLKDFLRKTADSYKSQLEIEVNESIGQFEKFLKTAAITVGGFLLGYAVYNLLLDTEEADVEKQKKKKKTRVKKSKRRRNKDYHPIVKAGAEVAATFLLSMARQKLVEYIKDLERTKSESNGYSSGDQ